MCFALVEFWIVVVDDDDDLAILTVCYSGN